MLGTLDLSDGRCLRDCCYCNQLPGKTFDYIRVVRKTTYESAKLCLNTNYYGVKNVTKAFLPLLQNSPSPRIVNVSSRRGALNAIQSHIYEILQIFLHDLKQDALEEGDEGPAMLALLPDGGPTGCYFDRTVLAEF
ncbi:hypothetical protein H5410_057322 [Solanum commersonii]|uniref:Uncharacterized protein n=1 Tax=Solanum commersonii TaxID=4109 RepID=A0A9J5WPT9_SOLCO|nr:hypothetical protein H5410_057322 [Solanum commersonii]